MDGRVSKLGNEFKTGSEVKWIPDGFHFLGHTDSKSRRELVNKFCSFFENRGYEEVNLPTFDFSSSFLNHIPETEQPRILKSRDLAGNEISPSIDLTLQVVKGMAGFSVKQGSHKVFYLGKVIKDNFKTNIDRREIFQAGAEILGHSNANTFKILFTHINELWELLGIKKKITVVLGNTSLYSLLSDYLGFSSKDRFTLSRFLYLKDVNNIELFLNEKVQKKDLRDFLKRLILSFDFNSMESELLELSARYNLKWETSVRETAEILSYASKWNNLDFCVDYSLVKDLDYYTGFIFYGYFDNLSFPVLSGGAYDNLYEKFTGESKRACGFAVNIDLIEEIIRN